MSQDYKNQLNKLLSAAQSVAKGDISRIEDLFAFEKSELAEISALADNIGLIIVQKEVREFQLEELIEELLDTKKTLEAARCDPLTGLPNRAMFEESLQSEFRAAKKKNRKMSLFFIDLDKFKQVNDTLGHAAGDELLVQSAARMEKCIDSKGIIGRIGGDEFVALLRDENDEGTQAVIASMLDTLRQPFKLVEGSANISASIGVAFLDKHASTPSELLKNADVAMYSAKAAGRDQAAYYRPSWQRSK